MTEKLLKKDMQNGANKSAAEACLLRAIVYTFSEREGKGRDGVRICISSTQHCASAAEFVGLPCVVPSNKMEKKGKRRTRPRPRREEEEKEKEEKARGYEAKGPTTCNTHTPPGLNPTNEITHADV